ncbi:sensor histidine kinase [Paraburkholderia caballeronis]|nr:HAMP domain-containing sensor histidine kinase [Paraburkholderia caballeronis]
MEITMSAHAHSFPPPADGVGQPDQDIPDGVVDGPFTRVVARFADGSAPVGASPGTTAPSDEILAIVAHELCNPLTPLQFAARALRLASVKRPEVSNMIDVIDRQIAQIARLAEDLTDATRVSRGELRLRKARVVLADVLSDFLDAAAVAAASRGQTFTVQIPDRMLRLEGDPMRLGQAVNNMVRNAVKYTPAGGAIEVSAIAEGRDLVVSVKDSGLGISAALLPHIFDLFAQSSRTLAASAGGLGIGLAVVKAVAEAHGGTVTAASGGPGKGSEFTLRLPVVVVEQCVC